LRDATETPVLHAPLLLGLSPLTYDQQAAIFEVPAIDFFMKNAETLHSDQQQLRTFAFSE